MLEGAHGRQPVTVSSLVADLTALFDDARILGIGPGCLLNVHSSLSQIGWVAGGAQAVIVALQEVIGPTGTLIDPRAHNPPRVRGLRGAGDGTRTHDIQLGKQNL